jgi:proton-coupled amino acid transporter
MVVLISAFVAYLFPHFGKFLGLVGSSTCTLLAFIFPCYFHLRVLGPELPWWQYVLDIFVLIGGVLFAIKGTYESVLDMTN